MGKVYLDIRDKTNSLRSSEEGEQAAGIGSGLYLTLWHISIQTGHTANALQLHVASGCCKGPCRIMKQNRL